jgi:hypothetical protein
VNTCYFKNAKPKAPSKSMSTNYPILERGRRKQKKSDNMMTLQDNDRWNIHTKTKIKTPTCTLFRCHHPSDCNNIKFFSFFLVEKRGKKEEGSILLTMHAFHRTQPAMEEQSITDDH